MSTTLRSQRTLARPATLAGFGYWSGHDITIEFRPAPPHSGLVFVRTDLSPERHIGVALENRREVPRRTVLNQNGATVEMVEHILAALVALRIDNCEIRASGCEMPGCDGSSLAFVQALEQAGMVEQLASRPRLVVTETTRVGNADAWVEARPAAGGGFHVQYELNYGPGPIGRQNVALEVTPETFRDELASARTFILDHEAVWLRNQGLCERVTYADLLVFGPTGPIENKLRYADECVRHKALDLVGDLALAGCDLEGEFVAHRSGHKLNAELVGELLKAARNQGEPLPLASRKIA